MNENEPETIETNEPEPVRVYMDELPPVTFAWAMNATLKFLLASLVFALIIGTIYVLIAFIFSIAHMGL